MRWWPARKRRRSSRRKREARVLAECHVDLERRQVVTRVLGTPRAVELLDVREHLLSDPQIGPAFDHLIEELTPNPTVPGNDLLLRLVLIPWLPFGSRRALVAADRQLFARLQACVARLTVVATQETRVFSSLQEALDWLASPKTCVSRDDGGIEGLTYSMCSNYTRGNVPM